MQTIETPTRLRVRYWCHLPPDDISLPHVPINPEQFPSAKNGFEDFSVATHLGLFGAKLALVDISGLAYPSIKERLWHDLLAEPAVSPARFLQCLEYMKDRREALPYERIAAYLRDGTVVAAEPADGGGFSRVPAPSAEKAWPPGTYGLFSVDEL